VIEGRPMDIQTIAQIVFAALAFGVLYIAFLKDTM
jgi:hypothetical protein